RFIGEGTLSTDEGASTLVRRPIRGLLRGVGRQLVHDLAQIEAARLLPQWEILEALEPLANIGLRRPEQERVPEPPLLVAETLRFGFLEGIRTKAEDLRQPQGHERILPHVETLGALLHEHDLPLVVPQAGEAAVVCPVQKFLARRLRRLSLEV